VAWPAPVVGATVGAEFEPLLEPLLSSDFEELDELDELDDVVGVTVVVAVRSARVSA
jgi:hypothetical protein